MTVAASHQVSEALVGERPDVLVSHRYRGYRVGVGLARRLGAKAHVAIAHEFGFLARRQRRWRRLLGDGRCRFAGVSQAVADDLGRTGVRRPLVLPNTLDGAAFRERLYDRSDARHALGLGDDETVIGVFGRLHPKKDPARALRGFDALRRRFPNTRLVFVGDGELRPALERTAGTGVTFAGFRGDARRLYAAVDVVLACATRHEAFGLVLLEALAAGVPIVCADQPGPKFVLGDCPRWFQTDQEMVRALADVIAQRNEWEGTAGIERAARQFSIDALAARYRSILLPRLE